jgi:hypothetical protein
MEVFEVKELRLRSFDSITKGQITNTENGINVTGSDSGYLGGAKFEMLRAVGMSPIPKIEWITPC